MQVEVTRANLVVPFIGLQEIDLIYLCLNHVTFSHIQIVNLENNPIGDNAGCLFVTLLYQYAKTLEILVLKNTQIKTHTIAALYLLIERKDPADGESTFKELSIANNAIQQEELCKLLVAISESSTLQTLDISGLNLNEGCLKLVATVIRYDKRLLELDISNNKLDAESQRELFAALARNRKLATLKMCNAGIDDESLKLLKLGLGYNRGLKGLFLDKNKITDDGLGELKDAIIGSKKMEVISIENNPIENLKWIKDKKEEIEKAIKCELKIGTKHAYTEHVKKGM